MIKVENSSLSFLIQCTFIFLLSFSHHSLAATKADSAKENLNAVHEKIDRSFIWKGIAVNKSDAVHANHQGRAGFLSGTTSPKIWRKWILKGISVSLGKYDALLDDWILQIANRLNEHIFRLMAQQILLFLVDFAQPVNLKNGQQQQAARHQGAV